MTNLISVVVAILLTIGAAIAGYFYFGPAADEGQGYRELATYSMQTLQVDGAYRAYVFDHDGTEPPGDDGVKLQTLVDDGYLSDAPIGSWVFLQGKVYQDIGVDAVSCKRINRAAIKDISAAASYGGCPPCDDATFQGYPGCTRDPDADTQVGLGN